jgi:hypothetical protein
MEMNGFGAVRRDTENANHGVKPKIINEIPMRHPAVAERFDDAKTPLPDIQTENKD